MLVPPEQIAKGCISTEQTLGARSVTSVKSKTIGESQLQDWVKRMTIENKATARAKDRLDLVKRFFSVAISIGVGSTLVNAEWIKNGAFPNLTQAEQLTIVLLALFATVLSWDGYLASVEKKPLNGWLRFAIDIFLVIIYTVLIITSVKPWLWLPILCVIFAVYVVWVQ
jgi:hypothetical protein